MKNSPNFFKATLVASAVAVAAGNAYGQDARPSFVPGDVPSATPCDGPISLFDWAQNVTDMDDETSGLRFRVINLSNPEIFLEQPFVSWPSRTLTYQLAPGLEGVQSSTVTAVLTDITSTAEDDSDTSEPVTWVIPAEGCNDADADGIEDSADPDVDLTDSDGDGMPDATDPDDDNDGLSDADEGDGTVDTDADGIPDSLDEDSDDDGIPDADETGDEDNDGIPDSQEPEGTDVSTDTDGDGFTDDIDTDDDNDGLSDVEEGDGEIDTDGDGIPDSLDPDSDNDGIGDNQSPTDTDGDGITDDIDPDDDNDGLPDTEEGDGDVDTDGDGLPDSLDPDSDNDGIGDNQSPDTDGDGITDDLDSDDDNDGLADTEEGDGEVDTDGDGLPDSLDPDSNNDGIGDGEDAGPISDDPETGDDADATDATIRTGLRGVGSVFDPLLVLLAAVTGGGLFRRKLNRSRKADKSGS